VGPVRMRVSRRAQMLATRASMTEEILLAAETRLERDRAKAILTKPNVINGMNCRGDSPMLALLA
jgi:hypothetical protein